MYLVFFFFSSRRRHTRCALVTGVQTCALPISDEENRSATADPLARTVADVLVRNALPGEIDRLDKDRLHAIAAFAAAAIAERPPGKPVVQVASGAESDGKRTSWVLEIGRAHV